MVTRTNCRTLNFDNGSRERNKVKRPFDPGTEPRSVPGCHLFKPIKLNGEKNEYEKNDCDFGFGVSAALVGMWE